MVIYMKKLYGIEYHHFKDSKKRTAVYYEKSEEAAKYSFHQDWGLCAEIDLIVPIETNKCAIEYQFGREVYGEDEFEFKIKTSENSFSLEVDNLLNSTIEFAQNYVHFGLDETGRYQINLMVCLFDKRPNWIY